VSLVVLGSGVLASRFVFPFRVRFRFQVPGSRFWLLSRRWRPIRTTNAERRTPNIEPNPEGEHEPRTENPEPGTTDSPPICNRIPPDAVRDFPGFRRNVSKPARAHFRDHVRPAATRSEPGDPLQPVARNRARP